MQLIIFLSNWFVKISVQQRGAWPWWNQFQKNPESFWPDLYLTYYVNMICTFWNRRYRDKKSSKVQNFWPSLFTLFILIEKNCTAFLYFFGRTNKISKKTTFGRDCCCIQQSRPKVKTNMSKSVQPARVSFFRSDILTKLVL